MDNPGRIKWIVGKSGRPVAFYIFHIQDISLDKSIAALVGASILSEISPKANRHLNTVPPINRCLSLLAISISDRQPELLFELLQSVQVSNEAEHSVIFPFIDPYAARFTSVAIRRFLREISQGCSSPPNSTKLYIHQQIAQLRKTVSSIYPSLGLNQILHLAYRLNIPFSRATYPLPVYHIGQGKNTKKFWKQFSDDTSHIATVMSTQKSVTHSVLAMLNLPVPAQRSVITLKQALDFIEIHNYPVVIKPANQDKGVGVTVDIQTEDELQQAFIAAKPYGSVLIEKHINGNDYRLLVINHIVAGVTARLPARLVGNGRDSINVLFNKMMTARSADPFLQHFTAFSLDDIEIQNELRRQGVDNNTIPANNEQILLRRNANVSTGGSHEDVTHLVHPDNIELAISACDAIGLDIAGIDFISPDISRSWKEGYGAICEINPTPALSVEQAPGIVLRHYFPDISASRITIVVALHSENDSGQFTHQLGLITNNLPDCVVVTDNDYNYPSVDLRIHSFSKKPGIVIYFLSMDKIHKWGFTEDCVDILISSSDMRQAMTTTFKGLLPLTVQTKMVDYTDLLEIGSDRLIRLIKEKSINEV